MAHLFFLHSLTCVKFQYFQSSPLHKGSLNSKDVFVVNEEAKNSTRLPRNLRRTGDVWDSERVREKERVDSLVSLSSLSHSYPGAPDTLIPKNFLGVETTLTLCYQIVQMDEVICRLQYRDPKVLLIWT